MVDSLNRYRLTNHAAMCRFKWPNLYRGLLKTTDLWLAYLEELQLAGASRIPERRVKKLQAMMEMFGVGGRLLAVLDAMDRIYDIQDILLSGNLWVMSEESAEAGGDQSQVNGVPEGVTEPGVAQTDPDGDHGASGGRDGRRGQQSPHRALHAV